MGSQLLSWRIYIIHIYIHICEYVQDFVLQFNW